MKVVFIGGLTEGKIVYDYLVRNRYVDLKMVITYADEYDGPRHVCMPDGYNVIKGVPSNYLLEEIRSAAPDLIFVAGWSELLSEEVLSVPRLGAIGFHPAKLPFDRGRSVLAWQIEEGYRETFMTMFYYSKYPDGGDIIAQEKVVIERNDYISDILDKMDMAIYNLIYAYFPLIRKGLAVARKQDLSEGNFRRLRKGRDSEIDWNKNSECIYNKIRAISRPYPGAKTTIDGIGYLVWKANIIPNFISGNFLLPGSLVATLHDKTFLVKTRDSFVHITDFTIV